MDKKEEKKQLRKALKQRLAALEREYCEGADKEIISIVCSLLEYQNASTVFCFAGTKREIDTRPILLDILKQGKRLGVPRCLSEGIMEVYEIKSLNELKEGSYGILEPVESCPLIRPQDIDLSLLPCLAAGKDGSRLGWGGGYYDRYLEKASGVKAVLCRGRMLEEGIPKEAHDRDADLVVSEVGIFGKLGENSYNSRSIHA